MELYCVNWGRTSLFLSDFFLYFECSWFRPKWIAEFHQNKFFSWKESVINSKICFCVRFFQYLFSLIIYSVKIYFNSSDVTVYTNTCVHLTFFGDFVMFWLICLICWSYFTMQTNKEYFFLPLSWSWHTHKLQTKQRIFKWTTVMCDHDSY